MTKHPEQQIAVTLSCPLPLVTTQHCKTYQPSQAKGTLSIQPTEMANSMLS